MENHLEQPSSAVTDPNHHENSLKGKPVSSYFGELTFHLGHMRERLSASTYKSLVLSLDEGKRIEKDVADAIAIEIKDWAVSMGATHFCHWFQPMTGLSAEKHDAFISIQHRQHSELKVLERLTGGQLIQGEPDASSFPSGGVRSTFEARGYTAWDPSSPIFLLESASGKDKTLCIPSVFFGYGGEALDFKTPLLRSEAALSTATTDFLRLLGDSETIHVKATLGPEQEYFLIDAAYAAKRPDIILTGKTLMGAPSPKGQELEDHYFGAVPNRVKSFWEDVEVQLYRLGIPIKTRHNEVAPSQFEIAPIFEDANIASDHNSLVQDVLKNVAKKHGFVCLLDEKPFKDLNGSGKHCNWSMRNNRGDNLLDPGKTPHQNLRFLAIVSVVVSAVYQHADVLRAAIASPGNDSRLGGNEAPPAIISIYLGKEISNILSAIASKKRVAGQKRDELDLGVPLLPEVIIDTTDRNRTSPFAFTGNRFELRAVGSSANISLPTTIINASVASEMLKAKNRLAELLDAGQDQEEATLNLIRELYEASRDVVFSGNNYSDEWRAQAKKLGLPCLDTTAEALEVFNNESSVQFLLDLGVYTKEELSARYNTFKERHDTTYEIQLRTLKEMARQYVIPALEQQYQSSAAIHSHIQSAQVKSSHQKRLAIMEETLGGLIDACIALGEKLTEIAAADESGKTRLISATIANEGPTLRHFADKAETLVSDTFWQLPRYRDMLFSNVFN